jgi:hypothetical protein
LRLARFRAITPPLGEELVIAIAHAGDLDVVDADTGRGERRLCLLQHLRVVGERIVRFTGQPHVNRTDTDAV